MAKNGHFLKVEKNGASLEELLVGDLLVHKITKTFKKEPVSIALKDKVAAQVLIPEGKAPLAIPSLEQLKMTISRPISSRFQSEHIILLSPVIKEGTIFLDKPYKRDIEGKYIHSGITSIPPVAKESGQHIYEHIEKDEFLHIFPSPCIIEKLLTATSTHRIIQLPIPEGIGIIHEIKLCEPIMENRIPID